ncbi:lymphotactin-like [Trachinotus anak]|uniref:lymphotactin-like n=1 Tax=Trachinotus anak TaxID=443729 RepID=UPI0039F19AC9
MRFSLVTLLCFITWMSSVHATLRPVGNCPCPVWSKTRPPIRRIVDYTVQAEGVCPIRAVVFRTVTGKRVCSDPNIDWVKTAMLKVDQGKKASREMEESEQGSASGITPAASTTSKNTPGKRHGRE